MTPPAFDGACVRADIDVQLTELRGDEDWRWDSVVELTACGCGGAHILNA